MTDLTLQTALEQLAHLNAKRVSARELLDAHVKRHEAVHARINAVVVTDLDRARREAAAVDDARGRGEKLGPLAGLPMTVKDAFDIDGMPARSGNPAYLKRDKKCADAEMIKRIRKAGAIVWGKTNVPLDLGDIQSFNEFDGTTNNPYDQTRTPGGSSGGSAAALACGITSLEIGSDIGGSLRHPANFCGVYSLKPTHGLLPLAGHVPPPPGMGAEVDLGVVGPMARNADDLRLLFGVLNNQPVTPGGRKNLDGMRIAVWCEENGFPLARDPMAAIKRTEDALEECGAGVVHAKPDIDGVEMNGHYNTVLLDIILGPDPQHADKVAAALAKREIYKETLKAFFIDYDAILMPITPTVAFKHMQGAPDTRSLDIDGTPAFYYSFLNWIGPATFLHPPALALPAGQTAKGLPTGVQLMGSWGSEHQLIDIAAAIEPVLGGFRPPHL